MKTIFPATMLCDFYKISHRPQYPKNTSVVYSTLVSRGNRYYPEAHEGSVAAGFQPFVIRYLHEYFNEHFFSRMKQAVIDEYQTYIYYSLKNPGNMLGLSEEEQAAGIQAVDADHIGELWELGFLPIEIKALPEGTLVPLRVPMLTIENTRPEFFWLTNYLETLLSNEVWLSVTSATTARLYRKLLDRFALETTGSTAGVEFQGHDFSMRGMQSRESATASGAAHLFSFVGSDTIPAIMYLENYYGADIRNELVATSIDASEHSVMCAHGNENEFELFKEFITEKYPSGFVSIVSDTWDFWKVVTEYLPALKDDIMARDGRVVIRPDSGDPVDIVCGTHRHVYHLHDELNDRFFSTDERLDLWYEDNQELLEQLTISKGRATEIQEGLYSHDLHLAYKGSLINITIIQDDADYSLKMDEIYFLREDYTPTAEEKGLIQCQWDIFGGTTNELGYKVLDPHVGAIYGDSIDLDRARRISEGLKAKGFASTNIVYGIGSFTYSLKSRDSLAQAVKATYVEVDGEERLIQKDPKTDDGTKKSLRGRVVVIERDGKLQVVDGLNRAESDAYADEDKLQVIFRNGQIHNMQTLAQVRERIAQS